MESKSSKIVKFITSRKKNKNGKRRQKPATAQVGRTAHADLRFRTPLFPPRFTKRLTYSEVGIGLSAVTGTPNTYFYSANGIYDPNITGSGHQPLGFDEMMAMYEQFTVTSSKVTVHCINASAAGVYGAFALYLSPDTTQITTVSRLIENGFIVWKTLYPINIFGSQGMLSLSCNVPTYFARNRNKRAILDDTELSGNIAANPLEQVYFGILAFDATGASNTVSLNFIVELEYEVIFSETRKLAQS
jgi:hypothetical protein